MIIVSHWQIFTPQKMADGYLHISVRKNTTKNGNVMRHGELMSFTFHDFWFLPLTLKSAPLPPQI